MPTGTEIFDQVSNIVIDQFNAAAISYGTEARHSYPVKREDIFSEPVSGGGPRAADECRGLIAYILANHIPLRDEFRQDSRLATNIYIARYLKRGSKAAGSYMIGTGCRLLAIAEYRKAYVGAMLRIASDGFETWNVGKAVRSGNCEQ